MTSFLPLFFSALLVPYGIVLSFIFVVRPLYFSFSFDAYAILCSLPLLYLFLSVLLFSRCSNCRYSIPFPDFSRIHIYIINALLFSSAPFSRVRPVILRAIRTRYATFPIFLFDMYARYLIRDPFYFVSISSSCCAKCIPRESLLVLASPLLAVHAPPLSRFSSLFLKFPATSLLRRWAILENTRRSIPSHYPR